ncbi:PadR family transcriptional regulator [Apirhabdus apintestini]|nr:PadR family transcriptional regulator [Enterobacteriaceae bacterium CA-0114]
MYNSKRKRHSHHHCHHHDHHDRDAHCRYFMKQMRERYDDNMHTLLCEEDAHFAFHHHGMMDQYNGDMRHSPCDENDRHAFHHPAMMHMPGHRNRGVHAMMRMIGRRGRGMFGNSQSEDGFSGHRGRPPFLRGRKFSADELQLLLLDLLKENDSYGYELIKRLEEKSGGFYKPSPGVIYPALTWLEDVGYVTVQPEGSRKRYALAPEGAAHLTANRSFVDALIERLEKFARQMDSVAQAMREERQPFTPELMEAVHALRAQIHEHHHSNEDVQRRVAAILQDTLARLKNIDA